MLATTLVAGCGIVDGVLGAAPTTPPASEGRPAIVATVGGAPVVTPTVGVAETIAESTPLPRALPPLPNPADSASASTAGRTTGRFIVPPPLPSRPVSARAATPAPAP